METLMEIDTDLLLAINSWRSEWADYFMYTFSGKWVWVPMYAAILYVIVRNLSWKLSLACIVTIALTITFADQVCATLIRPLAERLRPSNLENPISDVVQIVNGYRGGRYGFPSCHAANTFGLAFYTIYIFRNRPLSFFMLIWALLTCYSRAYLGVHYPGDLLAGAVVGILGATLCCRVYAWATSRLQRPSTLKHVLAPAWTGGLTIIAIGIYAGICLLTAEG